MSWRSKYRKASFRGVEFHAREVEGVYGRRLIINEYPQIESPYVEDMGRAFDEFAFEGYVVGDDYDVQLDALITACRDQSGPGRLVNPYRGESSVRCSQLRTRESSEEGGIARFFIAFFEEGELTYPDSKSDVSTVVKSRAQNLKDAVVSAFGTAHKVAGYIGFVRDAAVATVQEFTDYMDALVAPLNQGLDDAFSFSVSIDALRSDIVSLVNTPGKLAERVVDILGLVKNTFAKSEEVLGRIISDYQPDQNINYAIETPSRKQQAINSEQFQSLVRQVVVAERATVAVDTSYPTYQDAYVAREAIALQLDVEAELPTVLDDVYVALVALRADVVTGIPAAEQRLPELRKIILPVSLPALVVAYQVYEDAAREAEVVSRNRVRHPGFMPGGHPLEVVIDAR
jgi:prophage DNA circulation protein